jgi:hypothetical protein
MNRLNVVVGALVFLATVPAAAHVVGVRHAVPAIPEYERILDPVVTLRHAMDHQREIQTARDSRTGSVRVATRTDRSIAGIQRRRAERNDHLRVIQDVRRNLFRPVLWRSEIPEVRAVSGKSILMNLNSIQRDRDQRTGTPSYVITMRKSEGLVRELIALNERKLCSGRPRRVKKDVAIQITGD